MTGRWSAFIIRWPRAAVRPAARRMNGATTPPPPHFRAGVVASTACEADGRTAAVAFPNDVTTTFSYDPARRWLDRVAIRPDGRYGYDLAGNMTSNRRLGGEYAYPRFDQPRPHAPLSAGPRVYRYDENGYVTQDGTKSYRWDGANGLIGVDGADYTGFLYAPDGTRLKRTFNSPCCEKSVQARREQPFGARRPRTRSGSGWKFRNHVERRRRTAHERRIRPPT